MSKPTTLYDTAFASFEEALTAFTEFESANPPYVTAKTSIWISADGRDFRFAGSLLPALTAQGYELYAVKHQDGWQKI